MEFCKNGHPKIPENRTKDNKCKLCRRAKAKLWHENNKEKAKASVQLWRENNKEKVKADNKLWCENNKEKIKLWRENNKEKAKASQQRWCKNNKEKVNANQKKQNDKLAKSIIAQRYGLKVADMTNEFYELAKLNILLKREIKKCKQLKT